MILCQLCDTVDNNTAKNKPYIVSVKNLRIDADYATWLSEIKRRYIYLHKSKHPLKSTLKSYVLTGV